MKKKSLVGYTFKEWNFYWSEKEPYEICGAGVRKYKSLIYRKKVRITIEEIK